jgi:pimeloyl-ACP methyl ester carboxylesterase
LPTFTAQLREVSFCLDAHGGGPPLLLLHGFPATRQLWAQVAPRLVGAGFRVLIPDLIGYGASPAAAGTRIDMASQARWLLELLDQQGAVRPVVCAHDVGSAAAQLMVAAEPRRFRGLVVLDGVCGTEWAMDAVSSIQTWDPAQAHRLFPVLARRLGRSAALREMLASYEGAEGGLRLIRAARDLDPRQTASVAAQLRASGVPAAVLWGEHDEYLPIGTVGRPLAELLGAPFTSVPGGHFTPLDCPGEVAAALAGFVAGFPRETR